MPIDWVIAANSQSAELLRPDLTIFIDVSPELCMKRLNKNRTQIELYESLENLKNVRAKYFEAFEKLKDQEKIQIIDGNRTIEEIFSDIWSTISAML
jgi:dTMP kinase